MIVTRALFADILPKLLGICKVIGFVRVDIWRRFGALGNVGKSAADIRRAITVGNYYSTLSVDGTIRVRSDKYASEIVGGKLVITNSFE